MELLWLDPNYASLLSEHGLRQFGDFMACSRATVIRYRQNGSRHVALLSLGRMETYLKREFRIAYREKLRNWWDGFGTVGKSLREWRMLRWARRAGFTTPLPLACGQHGRQAFLLTAALTDFVPLDKYVAGASEGELRQLGRSLPRWLARWHACGFIHPDLYAWHVFVRVTDQQLAILDLARADWLEKVPWPERWRELALLGASLSESEWVWQVWDDVLETYLNTVESLQPHQAIRNREFAKNAVHRRMELWASWVSARQQEEEQCRAVLVSRLYTHDRV